MTSTVDSSGVGFEIRASLRLLATQPSRGQPVLCLAERLRLHPVVEELGCARTSFRARWLPCPVARLDFAA
jgi:hypothetical protein